MATDEDPALAIRGLDCPKVGRGVGRSAFPTEPKWNREDPKALYGIVRIAALPSYQKDRTPFSP